MKINILICVFVLCSSVVACGTNNVKNDFVSRESKSITLDSTQNGASFVKSNINGQKSAEDYTVKQVTARVSSIYNKIFLDYNHGHENGTAYDKMYCTNAYNKVCRKIDEATSKSPGEVIGIDYDHWVQAQDYENLSYKILSVYIVSPSTTMVNVEITNTGIKTNVTLKMVYEHDNWYIDDFIVDGNSEVKTLREELQYKE